MTERRVSQRTGNTETCQTELEGKMEGGRRGRKSRRERGGRKLEQQNRWINEARNETKLRKNILTSALKFTFG